MRATEIKQTIARETEKAICFKDAKYNDYADKICDAWIQKSLLTVSESGVYSVSASFAKKERLVAHYEAERTNTAAKRAKKAASKKDQVFTVCIKRASGKIAKWTIAAADIDSANAIAIERTKAAYKEECEIA